MKILFLDIDGVCNKAYTTQRFNGFLGIDPLLAQKVKDIVNETGCKVVLSSTWRQEEASREHVRQEVIDFIDITPSFSYSRYDNLRGAEIQDWLDKHPDVEDYVIIDDDNDMLEHQQSHFFQTIFSTGLTTAIKKKVIRYFNEGKIR